jgi:hypothetical protein
MVRRYLKMAFAMGLAGVAVASTPSCADNHESIFIQGVLAVTAPDCTAKADASAKILAYGIMELKLTNTYGNFVMVGNQLIARGDPNKLRAEPNRVQITGADVTLRDTAGTQYGYYSVPADGLIDPTTSSTPSYAPVFVQIIPAAIGNKIAGALATSGATVTLLADVKVYGQTLGLTNVESGIFTFSIEATNGGSIVRTIDTATGKVDCSKIPTGYSFTSSCFEGQDVSANPCFLICGSTPTDPVCL